MEQAETFSEEGASSANSFDLEQWSAWEKDPLPINSANLEELTLLPGVNEIMAHQLLEYRYSVGQIRSKYELSFLKSWDSRSIELVTPFISFARGGHRERLSIKGRIRHDLILRQKTDHTPVQDVIEGLALGNNGYGYLRYVGKKGRQWTWGLALEKDHGEAIHYQNKWLLHSSAFVRWKVSNGPIEELTLGSFRLSWGQGLALADGYRANSGPVLRSSPTVRIAGHASSSEYGFQNGIALRGRFRFVRYGFWYSRTPRSIKIDTIRRRWSTFYADGNYRTAQRVHWWHSSSEERIGGFVLFRYRSLSLGLLKEQRHWKIRWPKIMVKPLTKNLYSGVFRWNANSLLLSSEVYFSSDRLNYEFQSVWVPDDQWKMRLRYRKAPNLSDLDHPRFYFLIRPEGVEEFTFEQWWNPYSETQFYLFFRKRPLDHRYGFRLIYGSIEEMILQVDAQHDQPHGQIQGRIQARKGIGPWIGTIRSQWSRSALGNGALWYIDLQWRPNEKFRLYGRWTVFETDDFSHRLYAYENDLLYVFSVPAYFGKGTRFYALLDYKWKFAQVQFKMTVDRVVDWSIQYRLTF